jgi:uncharacterized phage protein (TIGR02220 family)
MDWIPLWVDKWIFGTTRIELRPDERSVWVDLMALAAKDNGFIRANVGVEYPIQQLAGLLCITEELLKRAIEKCLAVKKLESCGNGAGYYLPNWGEYQLSDRHKRRFKQNIQEENGIMSAKTDIVAENENKSGSIGEDIKKRIGKDILSSKLDSIPFSKIISYLNQKTGKNFSSKAKGHRGHIRARWNEGKREEDFQRVIDIKFDKWGTDEKMVDYLRPETLFGTKMDSYLNETPGTLEFEDRRMYEIEQLRKKNGNPKST